MAYSNDGAYLAVIDEKKVAIAYTVADNYSVNICLSYIYLIYGLFKIQYPELQCKMHSLSLVYNYFSLFFPRSKMSFTDTMPNQ